MFEHLHLSIHTRRYTAFLAVLLSLAMSLGMTELHAKCEATTPCVSRYWLGGDGEWNYIDISWNNHRLDAAQVGGNVGDDMAYGEGAPTYFYK